MDTNGGESGPTWRDVAKAVFKQTWLAAIIAGALMAWDYTSAAEKPSWGTFAKDAFLTFSFLMFFGNLWQRTRKQVEDKAELKSIRSGVKSVHELLMEMKAIGGPAPAVPPEVDLPEPELSEPAAPEVVLPEEKLGPVIVKKAVEDDREETPAVLFSRGAYALDEPASAVKKRVLRELRASPLGALVHTAMAIEHQLRRITPSDQKGRFRTSAAAVRYLESRTDIDPKLPKLVSRFLALRNAAVHESLTPQRQMIEAVMMGFKILDLLQPIADAEH